MPAAFSQPQWVVVGVTMASGVSLGRIPCTAGCRLVASGYRLLRATASRYSLGDPPGGVAIMLLLKGLVKRSPVLSSAERTPLRLVLVEWDRAVTAEPVTVAPVRPPAAALSAEAQGIDERLRVRAPHGCVGNRKHALTPS